MNTTNTTITTTQQKRLKLSLNLDITFDMLKDFIQNLSGMTPDIDCRIDKINVLDAGQEDQEERQIRADVNQPIDAKMNLVPMDLGNGIVSSPDSINKVSFKERFNWKDELPPIRNQVFETKPTIETNLEKNLSSASPRSRKDVLRKVFKVDNVFYSKEEDSRSDNDISFVTNSFNPNENKTKSDHLNSFHCKLKKKESLNGEKYLELASVSNDKEEERQDYHPMQKLFTRSPISTRRNHDLLKKLSIFLRLYFLKGELNNELLAEFNQYEDFMMAKMIGLDSKNIAGCLRSKNHLITFVRNHFLDNGNKPRKYKITNGKRFIYRKIKTIMYQRFKKEKLNSKQSKVDSDRLFCQYYFYSDPHFQQLSEFEKNALSKLYHVYEERFLHLLWDFKRFKEDFIRVFVNFKEELFNCYYEKKLKRLLSEIKLIKEEDFDFNRYKMKKVISLPLSHKMIDLYIKDFALTFGFYFK